VLRVAYCVLRIACCGFESYLKLAFWARRKSFEVVGKKEKQRFTAIIRPSQAGGIVV
jgi:hypothetical protein